MKYEKAMVTIIDLGEEEILTASGCMDAGQRFGDSCNTKSFKKQGNCNNHGNRNQWD